MVARTEAELGPVSILVNNAVVQGTFVLKKGEPKTFFKSGDSGNRIVHAFCPNCGTPIYSAVPGEPPGYSLRVGHPPSPHRTCSVAADLVGARSYPGPAI